ncbi:MAG: ATP-binding protein [Nitrospiraceae bacterium]|nr:ATP-binding protein [Nitrospiraceae bacterium]
MSRVLHTRPYLPSGTHPVETGRYTLSTPPLGLFCDQLKIWVENRAVGAIVTAPPRFGKSKGIRFAIHELHAELGEKFPVFSFSCQHHQHLTESRFFENLLSDFGHAFSDRGSTNTRQARLTQFLIQQACAGHHRRLVLIADEAQKLQEPHYNWLVDIYNKLDRQDIATTVVLVGQPELIHQRDAFEKAKKMQIVGRFMVHLHEFAGLRNLEDFTYCLKGYDEQSEYPEASGYSFTRYFFPSGFDAGWRLAKEAEILWEAFQHVRAEAKLPGTREIPMQYFSRTVEYVLKNFGSMDSGPPTISLNQWKYAIECSGYREAGRYI